LTQSLVRKYKGVSREDIYILNSVIINYIVLYIANENENYDMYKKLLLLAAEGLKCLQNTYKCGLVALSIQYYINLIKVVLKNADESRNGTTEKKIIPRLMVDEIGSESSHKSSLPSPSSPTHSHSPNTNNLIKHLMNDDNGEIYMNESFSKQNSLKGVDVIGTPIENNILVSVIPVIDRDNALGDKYQQSRRNIEKSPEKSPEKSYEKSYEKNSDRGSETPLLNPYSSLPHNSTIRSTANYTVKTNHVNKINDWRHTKVVMDTLDIFGFCNLKSMNVIDDRKIKKIWRECDLSYVYDELTRCFSVELIPYSDHLTKTKIDILKSYLDDMDVVFSNILKINIGKV